MTGIFPGIGEIGGPIDPKPPVVPKKEPPKPTELELANKRIAEMESSLADADQALRQSVGNAAKPAAPKAQAAPPPAEPGKMPDPATEPGDFEAWQTRTREWDRWENRQHVEKVRSSESSSNRSQKVIDRFITTNPKYAPLRAQVFSCYDEAFVDLGLSEIPDDTKALDALAAKKIKALTEAAAKALDLPTGDPNTDEDPAQRTAGLSGGSTGGGAGETPPQEDDGIKIRSLHDVMRERQSKSGLF